MNLSQQLNCLKDDNHNPDRLLEQLDTLLKNPKNLEIAEQGVRNNCYVNTETRISIIAHCNLYVKYDRRADINELVFTITDNYPEDKLLHVEITISKYKSNHIYCLVRKNDMHLTNDEIIKCLKECFGFYDEED